MTTATTNALVATILLALVPIALAQEGNNPPTIDIIAWDVVQASGWVVVYDRDLGIGSLSDIEAFIHEELDLIIVTLEIQDADWSGDPDGQNEENEQYYLRFQAVMGALGPPEAPPILGADEDFFGASVDQGFAPPPGQTVSTNVISFFVPLFLGKNQDRLRGLIDYDVWWMLEFAVSNEEEPGEGAMIDREFVFLQAIESPALGPVNPPAFADAGPDRTVPAGFEVILDGSRTFDSFNVGFDESDDENIFEKDKLTFTWEWLSGPVPIEPAQEDPRDPLALVTLDVPGAYVYRLIVDDNVNALPSTDSVVITVVSSLPSKNPPQAVIVGPANAVAIGQVITLDGESETVDPDGDELRFRWLQTNELGGQLTFEELQKAFLALSGVDEAVSTWQAISAGTFYFRLLVDDGDFRSSAMFSVEVVEAGEAGAGGTTGNGSSGTGDSGTSDTGADDQAPSSSALCGAGVLPLAVVPLALCVMRRRVR